MKAKVQAGSHPWIDSYNILIGNSSAQASFTPHAQPRIVRGTGSGDCATENYWYAMWDAAAAYQLSLRWQITGNNVYADTAINILNVWANTCTNVCGDSNYALGGGLYGYEFACAAENLRGYTNWSSVDFTRFQLFMVNVFYSANHYFLTYHNGTCSTHYWANWDLCNMASMLAIGVLCDDRAIYNEAISYYTNGVGGGAARQFLVQTHAGYLGQCQESGRDQGHCTMDPILLGVFCEIAWNQGDDMYGYQTNALLQVSEYVSKYNVQPLDNGVPFVCYMNCEYYGNTEAHGITPSLASGGRGTVRPGWSLINNHYANRLGLAAPWTGVMATQVNPEGGGGNYGSTSGGYDQLGFTTLTHTRDPIAASDIPAPGKLIARARNNAVTLSWFGSAGATSYKVKRAAAPAGPYANIATAPGSAHGFTNVGLTQGMTYYYAVSAIISGAETTNSTPASATPTLQLSGSVIGSYGSYNRAGAEKTCLFDGVLGNFYDALNVSGDWGGLDLGRSNVITQVAYCPRAGFSGRMVGGQFQGANVPDFSSGAATLITINSAPPGGTLTYQAVSNPNAFRYVRYIGPNNGSCNAAEIQFFGAPPVPTVPNAPDGLDAASGNGQARLSWPVPDTTLSFNVKRAANSGGPYATVATGLATSTWLDTGLSNFTNYYYVVSAVNSAGESADSAEAPVTPSPGSQPGNLVWSGAVDGTWDTSTRNWWTNLAPAIFQSGSSVLFDDAAGAATISLPSPVYPSSVTFNNASLYYYVSGGSINSSGRLTKLGSGTAFLASANSFAGGATISAGALTIQSPNALGTGTVTLNGGTLNTYGLLTFGNSIVVSSAGSGISLASANNLTLTGTISGNGSVTLGNSGNNNSLYLSGPNTMTGGTVTVSSNNNYVRFTTTAAGNGNADWVFDNQPSRATFDFASGNISFGSLSGNGSIQGNVNGVNSMNVTITVGANSHSTTFAGVIHNNGWGTGPIGLTKIGTGTLALTGANDYTGATVVNAGALMTSTASRAKGSYTVANGATFGITNSVTGSALVSNLTISAGATLDLQGIASTTTPLIAASNVIVSGSCTVKVTGTNGLAAGTSYPLVSYAGSLSGSLGYLQLQMPYGWRGELVSSAKQILLANVAPVATTPPGIDMTLGSSQLQLAWPATHIGWRLESQTNSSSAGLSTNWSAVAGSTGTNQMAVPIDPGKDSVFFRLVYP